MLIEFTVRNYRSIRDEQVLSFLPAGLSELTETNTLDSNVNGVGRLLASAVIYGANAAGKTTVLDALLTMRRIVIRSADSDAFTEGLPVKPFRLDDSETMPTMFEAVFTHDGQRFQYGFEATQERVIEEWLYAYPEKRSQRVFIRKFDPATNDYSWQFGAFLKGAKATWRDATRPNALFLSTAALLNSEQLSGLRDWFGDHITPGSEESHNNTARVVQIPEIKKVALRIMKTADISIVDFEVKDAPPNEHPVMRAIRQGDPEVAKILDARKSFDVHALHRTSEGKEVWFDLSEESEGTRVLFSQIGPMVKTMGLGGILVYDELNNNLHPLLARAVVKMFHSPQWNPNGAQLLFTTHATSLLSTEILRRDQIWFAEKTQDGVTKIYPMTDFEPRKDASLAKHYLQGRFGAIPYISAEPWDTAIDEMSEEQDG
ncbi:ATP-binding protein [Luteibacter sp. 329MFSha]|uniref:AAA family ATPase n=1 Tax=Luteibacter sp. 329MFSha TaxID=1798239 RepID=UPI0008D75EB6|nr:ATP-binding protein [Luteibacter sp. 329MFSha]SEW25604.1 hypothetical protein SAMN04515660_3417 [Luteibacter sp. 329MFSha]